MEWVEEYSLEKILPLVTRYDLTHMSRETSGKHLVPHKIVKARVRQGNPCYEIHWNKIGAERVDSLISYYHICSIITIIVV